MFGCTMNKHIKVLLRFLLAQFLAKLVMVFGCVSDVDFDTVRSQELK